MQVLFWSVCYGPDISHLWDVKIVSRLKDAKSFASTLQKPYRIYRHQRDHELSRKGLDNLLQEKTQR